MRIARIRHLFYPDMPRDYFYELSARQAKAGHEVHLMTWRKNGYRSEEKIKEGFVVHRLSGLNLIPFGVTQDYPFLPGLPAELAFLKPDIIHAESHLFLPTFQAVRTAKKLNLPCVITVHGLYANRSFATNALQLAYIRTIASDLFEKADKVICLTRSDAEEIVGFGCPLRKISIIPNAVDTELFTPSASHVENNLIVWVGRFVKEKGLEFLIEAAAITVKKIKTAKFLLIGYGPLKTKILELIHKYQLETYVTVIGPLTREEIANILGKATIFAFPSLREGLPVSVLEALSCGLPIVGFDVPGVRDIVRNNETGILVPPKNAKLFSDALVFLINNNDIRKKFGKESRDIAIRLYSWNKVMQKINSVYEDAISSSIHNQMSSLVSL